MTLQKSVYIKSLIECWGDYHTELVGSLVIQG